jgi:type II secretory pathway pseudopilin PulG
MSADTRYPPNCRLPIADCRLKSNRESKIEDRRSRTRCGFLLTEIIIALSLLGLLLGGLGVSLAGLARFNRYQLTRQQCIAAAQAQLESIAATSAPIPDKEFTRLWPRLTVSIRQTPGEGQWQGLTLVEVTASDKPALSAVEGSRRKNVEIQLSRYLELTIDQ